MTEQKVYELTVDPEFRDLIPPLNEEELKLLEASLVADGCESPLIVWNGVIVDGHNRYAICRKHEIPFSIQEKNFSSRDDAMLWMLRNQLGRRNLNDYQRGEMVLVLKSRMFCPPAQRKMRRPDGRAVCRLCGLLILQADLEARAGCGQSQSAVEPAVDSGAAGHCRKVPQR